MSEQQAYCEKMEAQLRDWSARIDALQAKTHKLEADAKLKAIERVNDLRAQQAAVREKLDSLTRANDAAWEDIKLGVEKAWSALTDAVQDAATHFGK